MQAMQTQSCEIAVCGLEQNAGVTIGQIGPTPAHVLDVEVPRSLSQNAVVPLPSYREAVGSRDIVCGGVLDREIPLAAGAAAIPVSPSYGTFAALRAPCERVNTTLERAIPSKRDDLEKNVLGIHPAIAVPFMATAYSLIPVTSCQLVGWGVGRYANFLAGMPPCPNGLVGISYNAYALLGGAIVVAFAGPLDRRKLHVGEVVANSFMVSLFLSVIAGLAPLSWLVDHPQNDVEISCNTEAMMSSSIIGGMVTACLIGAGAGAVISVRKILKVAMNPSFYLSDPYPQQNEQTV